MGELLAHCLCAAISGYLEQQLHLSCADPACRTGPSAPWRETVRTSGGAAWLPTLARWHSRDLCRTPCARQTGCWPPGLPSWMQPSSLQVSWVSRLWFRVDLVWSLSSVLLMEYTLLLSPELVHGTWCLVPGSLHCGLIKGLVPAGWEQPIDGHRGTRVWSQQLLPGVVAWCHAERHQGFYAVLKGQVFCIHFLGAGARGASVAPGERRGKGSSVPRTDVVAVLQAAAARTPPPPSRGGMPAAPAAGTGLAAAAAAAAGVKPNQAAASVPVGSVSAGATVLVSEGHAGCPCCSCGGLTVMIVCITHYFSC